MEDIKGILLETEWGGLIDCSDIDYRKNDGLGGHPTFKNDKLLDLNFGDLQRSTSIIVLDDEVRDHFMKISYENFINEEMAREDFMDMIKQSFGFSTKEEYIKMSTPKYFREIFLFQNAIIYPIRNTDRFFMI